jgi:hypothetical protein
MLQAGAGALAPAPVGDSQVDSATVTVTRVLGHSSWAGAAATRGDAAPIWNLGTT